jgi:hypothetical protein
MTSDKSVLVGSSQAIDKHSKKLGRLQPSPAPRKRSNQILDPRAIIGSWPN